MKIDLKDLEKYSQRISALLVKVEDYDNDDDGWKITLDKPSQTIVAVSKLEYPTKLQALIEAKRNVDSMIQGEFQREFFKQEYGIEN